MSTVAAPGEVEQLDQITARPTCESGWALVRNGQIVAEQCCGETATHQVLHTCCTHIKNVCDEHAAEDAPGYRGEFCVKCGHQCPKSVCHHRVVVPL